MPISDRVPQLTFNLTLLLSINTMSKAPLPDISQIPDDGKYYQNVYDPMRRHLIIHPIDPPGVTRVIGGGNSCRVGFLKDGTVLKYPLVDNDWRILEIEAQIFSALGTHQRLVKYLGKSGKGLKLELVEEGSVKNYLARKPISQIPVELRLKWARQAAEAVAFIHSKGVIHCDIHTNNLLLDGELDIKLCDFQGTWGPWDGQAMESVRSFLPRESTSPPTVTTDLFALGSAIYEIMTGHEPYEHFGDKEVEERYLERQFPAVDAVTCGVVIQRCWMVAYRSAQETVHDLIDLSDRSV